MAGNEDSVEFVEGWLHIWELVSEKHDTVFSQSHRPKPKWEPRLCVFRSDKNMFTSYESEESWMSEYIRDISDQNQQTIHSRLDGGVGCFHKRWGYRVRKKIVEEMEPQSLVSDSEDDRSTASTPNSNRTLDISRKSSSASPASTPTSVRTTDNSRKSSSDSSHQSEDIRRRESVPLESTRSESMESVSTTFWLVNFFIKKGFSGGQKSSSKTDRKSSSSSLSEQDKALLNTKEKSSRSHESVLSNSHGMRTIDLSDSSVDVKPLHSSVLGSSHCIQIATPQGNKYLSCTTAEEMDSWLSNLRRKNKPNDEHLRRSDSSLKIWIVEAKNVTPKRSYFCDILLDNTLCAKTSAKSMTEMLFWGEHFELKDLPSVEVVRVNLYREADKKKKKDKNALVGYINLTISELENRQITEKWINCQTGTVGKAGKEVKSEIPIIRVKVRRQTVDILPIEYYQDFIKHLSSNYKKMCQIFEPLLAVKEKEDFATSIIHILQSQGKACEFLADIVMDEISQLDNEHLTFRGNSIATKAVEAYMKLVGAKYLHNTLGDLVNQLIQSPDDCEVDPTKVATSQLLSCQQKNLDMYSNMAWVKIINSYCYFPNEIRQVFASFRHRCTDQGKGDYSDNLISGCIFLRFLCPAILYPSLFNLTQEYPNERASRTLTLIAKTIQTLANFTQFGIKEDYMTFMNSFVEKEAPNMKNFLHRISSLEASNQFLEFDGHIDLGKELSVLHALLAECIKKYSETAGDQFEELNTILKPLTIAFDDPTIGQKRIIRKSQTYDNVLTLRPQADEGCQLTNEDPSQNLEKTHNQSHLSLSDSITNNSQFLGTKSEKLALANSNSPIKDSRVLTLSGSKNISRSISAANSTGDIRNVQIVRPNRIQIDHPINQSLKRSMSETETGDYVDITLLPGTSSSIGSNQPINQPGHPLAFSNPLFQQTESGNPNLIGSGNQQGIHMGHARTVRRSSTDSSGDDDDDDLPWQVKLAMTSSPLQDPTTTTTTPTTLQGDFSFDSSQQFDSFCSINESVHSDTSCFDSPSFYTGSPDISQSTSPSYMSCLSPTQPFSDNTVSGYSTFPRRQKIQQETIIINNINSSKNLANETKNISHKNEFALNQNAIIFNRQFSIPNQTSTHNPQNDVIISKQQPGELPTQIKPSYSRNIHGIRSYPDGFSSVAHKINQLRNVAKQFNSIQISKDTSNFTKDKSFLFNNSNSGTLHGIEQTDSAKLRNKSSSEILSVLSQKKETGKNESKNYSILKQAKEQGKDQQTTPSAITKSAGWKIALQMEKTTPGKDKPYIGHSSPPHSSASSPHKSAVNFHNSSSETGKTSSTLPQHFSNAPLSPLDSSKQTSIFFNNKSTTEIQNEPSPSTKSKLTTGFHHEFRDNSTNKRDSHSTNKSISNAHSACGLHAPHSPSPLASNPNFENLKALQQNNSQIYSPNPLNLPPSFLTAKYAIVRPHIAKLNQDLTSSRAASCHSTLDSKPHFKSARPFTTSRSLDLGLIYQPSNDVANLEQNQNKHRTSLEQTQNKERTSLEQTQNKHGQSLEQTQNKDRPSLEQIQNKERTSLEQTQNKDRTNLEQTSFSKALTSVQPCSQGLSTLNTGSQPNLSTVNRASLMTRIRTQSATDSGMSSVMRKLQEQEKVKLEFENEVHVLRQQLLEAQERLHQTELRLLDNEMDTQQLTEEFQNRLEESEVSMRRQQAEKDEYMEAIIKRLHLAEEDLKKEHEEMLKVVEHKQEVIEVQERRIQSLDLANKRLLQALADFHENSNVDENRNSTSDYNGVDQEEDKI